MLRFNTFRDQRYLRSRFVQGRFLLSSEGSDLELEILDLLREETKKKIGNNVAFGEAFELERLTSTQLLLKAGEAWFEGLPFDLRSSSDQLFREGQLPVGVTLESDSLGRGKLLKFNDSNTTPTNDYKIVLTAREELITSAEDPFLKNANIAESTGQKMRLVVQVSVVPKELQTDKPVPYTDQNSTSSNTTNYPDTGNSAAPNLTNKVVITPESGRNGQLESTSAISSSKEIDGRDLEITITNDPNGLANVRGQVQSFTSTTITVQSESEFNTDGGNIDVNGDQFSYTSYDKSTGQFSGVSPDPSGSISNGEDVSPVGVPIPTGSNSRDEFSNGTLIDSNGTEYHINLIENDNTNTKSIIRLDKEVGQADPIITNGKPYTLEKRPVYATDDVNGSPQGKLYWPVGDVVFDSTNGVVSSDSITDLRNVVLSEVDFQNRTNQQFQEDKSTYLRSDSPVLWTGTQLEFDSDLVLEIANAKTGVTTTHSIPASEDPITLADGEAVWVEVDREADSETLTVNKTGTTPLPDQTHDDKDIFVLFKRLDAAAPDSEKVLYLPFTKQLISEGQLVKLGAAFAGTGVITADLYDPVSTSLTTGSPVVVDGVTVADGDRVLFSSLTSDNNSIYEATVDGSGNVTSWERLRSFGDFSFTPEDGEHLRIQRGNAFQEQLVVFDGSDFLVNDIIRLFDGPQGTDFWELSSIKTSTLSDNTTDGEIFSVGLNGSENWIVSYSVQRGSGNKETGQIYITSDGTDVSISVNNTLIGDPGVEFNSDISSGNIRLLYTTTSTGSDATMKFFVHRWSNTAGGPTGVPDYSSVTGGSDINAAGDPQDIQFHGSGGNLAGDASFKWDSSESVINLDGLKYGKLEGPVTLNDNQTTADTIFTYDASSNKFVIIDYSLERGGETRMGKIMVTNNGSIASFGDEFVSTDSLGITFDTIINGSNVEVQYTSTSTGNSASMKYSRRRWN